MKKILLVCNTSWGIVMFRKGVIRELINEGYKLTVLAPYDDHSSEIEKLGCSYIDLPIDNQGTNILNDIKLIVTLYKHYRDIKPDLIFHYTIKPNIYGTLAAHYAGVKSIAVITGLGYTFINSSFYTLIAKWLYRVALKRSKRVWFINHEDRKVFIKEHIVSRNLIDILPSEGVNTKKYAPKKREREDGKFIFVLIARLLWDKGVGEYVEAARRVSKSKKNVEFWLVGYVDAKNPQAISKDEVESWHSKGWINYLGSTDDVRDYINEADCVVLPSYREGISKILLEAASMMKPVIASNVPGCRDVVEHFSSGYLCRVKDTNDLVLKMNKVLSLSKSELHHMGIQGRLLVKNEFDEEIIIDRYIQAVKYYTSDCGNRLFSLKKYS